MKQVEIQVNQTTEQPSNKKDIVACLRAEATKSPVFSALAHVFALRERTRSQITLSSLAASMKKEGFQYSRQDLEKALKFMASIGIGAIETDGRGRTRVLKGIKVTLQSVGLAAISKKDSLEKFTLANKFSKLPIVNAATPPSVAKKHIAAAQTLTPGLKSKITAEVGGKIMTFELPKNMEVKDIFEVMADLYQRNVNQGPT